MELRAPKTIIYILLLLAIFSLYLSYTYNSCLIAGLRRVIPKWHLSDPESDLRGIRFHYAYASVRVVPLLDSSDLGALNQSTEDGAPRYKFLREEGLRPGRQLPSALIVGVKKAGTRALLEFIRLHPDVRAAGNEIHFFDKHYSAGFEWYRNRMPATLDGQLTIEKTPSYFVTREAPRRVHLMNPSTRLLLVVRDPVTRAISDYAQAVSKKPQMAPFERLAFVQMHNDVGNGNLQLATQQQQVNTSWGPIRLGLYARYLARWLRYFPLSQFLFVSGERLAVDPAAELRRVQDFLGLKRLVAERHFYFNATKGFPCLYKSEGGRGAPKCLGKTKGRSHPSIDPVVLNRLRDFYRAHNKRFYLMTGINFGWP